MKYIILIVFLAAFGSMLTGYIMASEKLIGLGVMGLFFVAFPLFAYYRWKDKDIKDYMLTKENLDKMRENSKDKRY
ncbi:hypothetical protein [Siansivirga zeaxanthinifaciens]|uniref:Membrane protein n=1 Tax=Siansivirga zeaxanthinifaciens CC-SAMT-1 TaxID=1454006 RepID=A0A0C5W7G9_9FLAO|nr:hypothetical protein [Siansivirga zeaxanthinifaciens]AJR03098.1 membrane protein [Siansivirga zeaxanthinifaciens CC-SAMT-1]